MSKITNQKQEVNFRSLSEIPQCCRTCTWFQTYSLGEPYCKRDLDTPFSIKDPSRSICDEWKGF